MGHIEHARRSARATRANRPADSGPANPASRTATYAHSTRAATLPARACGCVGSCRAVAGGATVWPAALRANRSTTAADQSGKRDDHNRWPGQKGGGAHVLIATATNYRSPIRAMSNGPPLRRPALRRPAATSAGLEFELIHSVKRAAA
jgi:hypothetical protein